MPLKESEAIILRTFPLGEADRVVSFLSRTMGRMRGVAQGARRTKSRFGSSLEPLSYVRMWFFERETRDLVRISQCELLESFLGAQKSYEAGMAISLVSEITEAVVPEREASDATFRLILLTAAAIQSQPESLLPLSYFTLWTVRLGGWLPDLKHCLNCGAELGNAAAHSSHDRGGVFCAKCRLPGMRTLSGAARSAADKILADRLDRIVASSIPDSSLREIQEYSLDLIEHQLEKKLKVRAMMQVQL